MNGLRSKSRKESEDWQIDNNSILEADNDNMENEENDKNELNASNENIGFGMERAKYSHQTHNRRIDFPNRKSAGGSSALSQISQAKQSLGQL